MKIWIINQLFTWKKLIDILNHINESVKQNAKNIIIDYLEQFEYIRD